MSESEDRSEDRNEDAEAVEEFVDKASKDVSPLAAARDRYAVCELKQNEPVEKDGKINHFAEGKICPNLRVTDPTKETVYEGRVRLTLRCKTCGIEEIVLAKFFDEEENDATDRALERMDRVRKKRAENQDAAEEFFRLSRGSGLDVD